MKTLIIATPSAINESYVGKIITKLDELGVSILGIKMSSLDIHNLSKQKQKEKNLQKKKEIQKALKVPCVLIIAKGGNAIQKGKEIEKIFGNEKVHVSQNLEIAKYEIERFFKKKEIFEYEKIKTELFK